MTYARFLALFLGLPLLVLALRKGERPGPRWPLAALLAVVYVATTPWDHAAVAHGLWDFAPDRIWGPRVFLLPAEELLFFALQTLLTGLWARRRLRRAFAGGA